MQAADLPWTYKSDVRDRHLSIKTYKFDVYEIKLHSWFKI